MDDGLAMGHLFGVKKMGKGVKEIGGVARKVVRCNVFDARNMVTPNDEVIGLGTEEEDALKGAQARGIIYSEHDAPARSHVGE